jgi:hypothetical protein
VDRAAAGGDQQGSAVVFVQDPGAAFRRPIAHRVEAEAGDEAVLVVQWQDLSEQGVVRIALAHAGRVAPRDPQRELGLRRGRDARRHARQAEAFQQFDGVAEGVTPQGLPTGRLPGGGGNGYHHRLHSKGSGAPAWPATA